MFSLRLLAQYRGAPAKVTKENVKRNVETDSMTGKKSFGKGGGGEAAVLVGHIERLYGIRDK